MTPTSDQVIGGGVTLHVLISGQPIRAPALAQRPGAVPRCRLLRVQKRLNAHEKGITERLPLCTA